MVFFVGAGPGAADLITVRGMEKLKEADLVIYAGSLVQRHMLDYCRHGCEFADSAHMTLEEVIELIEKHSNKTVVRLHSGDPSIYGAIHEQIAQLKKRSIDCEVVPGVSSMCAAAAALQAEYTVPGISQSVIISRMAGRTPVPESESIRSLAAHKASMVLFLSVNMLESLCGELVAGGLEADTPVAVVYKASRPDEEIILGTLGDIARRAAHIKSTALVLVGRFLEAEGVRSKLYDPAFTHGFREAER